MKQEGLHRNGEKCLVCQTYVGQPCIQHLQAHFVDIGQVNIGMPTVMRFGQSMKQRPRSCIFEIVHGLGEALLLEIGFQQLICRDRNHYRRRQQASNKQYSEKTLDFQRFNLPSTGLRTVSFAISEKRYESSIRIDRLHSYVRTMETLVVRLSALLC